MEVSKTVLDGIEHEITIYQTGASVLGDVEGGRRFELYILETELPDFSGLFLARRIYELQPEAVVILLTEYLSRAEDGYLVNAYRTVSREHFDARFRGALRDGVEEARRRADRALTIQHYKEFYRIPFREIVYLAKEEKYTLVVDCGGREYRVRGSLRELQEKLGGEDFVLVERGYLVNLAEVRAVEKGQVLLSSGAQLPVSRKHVDELLSRVRAYWGEDGSRRKKTLDQVQWSKGAN